MMSEAITDFKFALPSRRGIGQDYRIYKIPIFDAAFRKIRVIRGYPSPSDVTTSRFNGVTVA
jgi:hypothetical protein